MKYAAKTTTPVAKTKGEILALLVANGASGLRVPVSKASRRPDAKRSAFTLRGLRYRFEVRRPVWEDVSGQFLKPSRVQGRTTVVEKEWMRRWRARLLWVKATLEFADGDSGEVARLLLPFLVLPDGRTLATWVDDQLPDLYSGRTPPLLLESGT